MTLSNINQTSQYSSYYSLLMLYWALVIKHPFTLFLLIWRSGIRSLELHYCYNGMSLNCLYCTLLQQLHLHSSPRNQGQERSEQPFDLNFQEPISLAIKYFCHHIIGKLNIGKLNSCVWFVCVFVCVCVCVFLKQMLWCIFFKAGYKMLYFSTFINLIKQKSN